MLPQRITVHTLAVCQPRLGQPLTLTLSRRCCKVVNNGNHSQDMSFLTGPTPGPLPRWTCLERLATASSSSSTLNSIWRHLISEARPWRNLRFWHAYLPLRREPFLWVLKVISRGGHQNHSILNGTWATGSETEGNLGRVQQPQSKHLNSFHCVHAGTRISRYNGPDLPDLQQTRPFHSRTENHTALSESEMRLSNVTPQ